MSKYTYTMALATINECHNRECQAGHWLAAGITGQLHADFVKMSERPEVTIPTVEDIRPAVTRYIRRINLASPFRGPDRSALVNLWLNDRTSDWGIEPGISGLPPIPRHYAQVSVIVYHDSHPGDVCRYLISELRDEVGITEVDDEHPLLRDLRAERDPRAVAALKAALS